VRCLVVRFSDAAVSDILEQADWYKKQSDSKLAQQWEIAVHAAVNRIIRNPLTGAPCSFKSSELRGVRRMQIERFSRHLIFYRIDEKEITVLRILHGARDLESIL
jgi:toxin ParE1/3/4